MDRPQLHLITHPGLDAPEQVRRIELAIPHGVDAVHVRLPGASAREVYDLAMALQASLVERDIPLIVNDRIDVALAVNAGGVQVGARGLPLRAVRRLIGPVGVSVHSVEDATAAERDGATWLTFGHVWETGSHPGETARGVGALRGVVEAVDIPVIAIGGVTAARGPEAIAAGASGVAVISAILGADDPGAATREIRAALDSAQGRRRGGCLSGKGHDMRILLNREEVETGEGTTIAALVEARGLPVRSVIVAVNDDVIDRDAWHDHPLNEGDSVEIVRAVSGGDHDMTTTDTLTIAGHEFSSRLFLGTGKYTDDETMMAALRASGTQLVTVAVRYMKLDGSDQDTGILDLLSEAGMHLLPNTAGAYTVRDAVKMARLARAATGTNWIKLEVIGDKASLWPDVTATVEATRILVDEGFVVLPYTAPDVVIARQLEEAGAATVMPLASPIGSGQGMQDWASIRRIVEAVSVPVVVDAGIGVPSDASIAMELGADAVLVNTAVAKAERPPVMAAAMRHGTVAGRLAYLAGRMPKRDEAHPSSPTEGVPTALAGAANGRS